MEDRRPRPSSLGLLYAKSTESSAALSRRRSSSTAAAPEPATADSHIGWAFERVAFLSFASLVLNIAMTEPADLTRLSQSTLVIYVLYFSLDKASPHVPLWVRLLHALALNASLMIGFGFVILAALSAPRYGSFVGWSQELDRRVGQPERTPYRAVFEAVAIHAWPVVAMLVDLYLRWPDLRRCYRAASYKWLVAIWLVSGGQALGYAWSATLANGKSGTTDIISLYAAPRELIESWSVAIADAVLGMSREELLNHQSGLGTDFALAYLVRVGGGLPGLVLDVWLLRLWVFAKKASSGAEVVEPNGASQHALV